MTGRPEDEAETRAGGAIRSILVALDASEDSLAALEAALALASELGAEIRGVHVQDTRILRAERIPLGREIRFFSGEVRSPEAGEMERDLRAQAKRLESVLRAAARRAGVPFRFRTTRGAVEEELRQAAREVDLIALGLAGRSLIRGPGSTVRALLRESPTSVLLTRRGGRVGRSVHVLHDGSDAARRALRLGAVLSRREGWRLTVSVLPPGSAEGGRRVSGRAGRAGEPGVPEGPARGGEGGGGTPDEAGDRRLEALEEELGALGEEVAASAEVYRLPSRPSEGLAELLRRRGCGLLVAPRGAVGEGEELRKTLRTVNCPLLVVA